MEPRFPTGSSALPTRRNEIRRRSGQGVLLSPLPEAEYLTSAITYAPSWRLIRHPNDSRHVSEDDPHRLRSPDDTFSTIFPAASRPETQNIGSPTVMLVRSRGSELEGSLTPITEFDDTSNDSAYLQVESPLPPLPEEESKGLYRKPEQSEREDPLSQIPLTPRPEAPPRFPSQDSQASKTSQRSTFSLFSRLPTPDFTRFNRDPLKQSIIAPLNFLRARTPSVTSVPSYLQSSIPLGSDELEATSISESLHISTATPEKHPPCSSRTESLNSTTQSIDSSRTLCDNELYSAFMVTAPSHFTRKFPSPASVSSFGGPPLNPDIFEGMVASESGNELGVGKVGTWTSYKWCLLLSVLSVFGYAIVGFLYSILTWFGTHSHANVMWVADNDILIFITLASTLLLFTGLVGLSGTLLNSRPILAFYALLLWPSFVSVLVVGYTSYKREAFSLDRKLNMAWSQWYDDLGRLLIQESLHCCGFYNPLHEATFSKNCYPRTPLPGCKGKLFRFEKDNLRLCWRIAFSLVPFHILNITVSLLCSNHVDRRFGKGLTPRAYRLSMTDVRANADIVLAQFAETKLPLEPSRSFSHVTDREDRPAVSRMQHRHGQAYSAIGRNFLGS